jgi:hypothetical protein
VLGTTQLAIIGTDRAASRLAGLASLAGCTVRLHDGDPRALDGALQRLRDGVEADLALGLLTAGDKQRILDGVLATTDLDEAVTHADLVAVLTPSATAAARATLLRVGEACRASVVVATPDPPDALMDWLPNPGRLVQLDPHRLGVAGGVETAERALALAKALLDPLRREGVLATHGLGG